jgi:hypothetical protein
MLVAIVPCVVRFTKKAPKNIPGTTRYPKIRSDAIAMPVGGQTAVALEFTKASDNPSFPET